MSARGAERGNALAEQIMTQALIAGLGADGRLPTERQLAADLGVTRSAVRYALGILEADGHISREVGRGTYLRSAAGAPDTGGGRAETFAPADVMVVRRLIEPQAMQLAVAWASAADFDEMDRCLAGGDRSTNYDEFELWDLALHRCIIASTRSQLLRTMYSPIETARAGHAWGGLKRKIASAERRGEYQGDHHAVVAALKARDASAAVSAMRRHLARVSNHLDATDPAAGNYP